MKEKEKGESEKLGKSQESKVCFLHMPKILKLIFYMLKKAAKCSTCKRRFGQFWLFIARE